MVERPENPDDGFTEAIALIWPSIRTGAIFEGFRTTLVRDLSTNQVPFVEQLFVDSRYSSYCFTFINLFVLKKNET